MSNFNAVDVKEKLVQWLRDYFNNNGNPINAVVGCSGGKDSTVVLAALVEAVGADRVYAVLMPNGEQSDISDSYEVCNYLGLTPHVCNIKAGYDGILESIVNEFEPSEQAKINLAPVLRMATLKEAADLRCQSILFGGIDHEKKAKADRAFAGGHPAAVAGCVRDGRNRQEGWRLYGWHLPAGAAFRP